MPKLVLSDFRGGLNTKADPWKLAPNQLQLAENVILRDGNLTPLKALGPAITTGLGAGTWSWIWKLGSTWLASTAQRFAVVWQNTSLAYVEAGLAYYTNGSATSALGLATPTAAITAALGAAGVITNTTAAYVYTWVDSLGQESGPSPVSNVVAPNLQQVTLTGIANGPAGTVAKLVYRVTDGTFRATPSVVVNDNVTTTGTDNTADTSLGLPLLTSGYGAAPALDVLAINTFDARTWGAQGSTVYWSAPGVPGAFTLDSVDISGTVVCMGAVGQVMIAFTNNKPVRFTGPITINGRDAFSNKEAGNTYGCPTGAGHSLSLSDMGLIYWSDQGLVLTDGVSFTLLSRDHLSKDDVDAYTAVASSMTAAYSEGYYHLFTSIGTLTCDLRGGSPVFTTNTQAVGAVFTALDGTLYASSGNAVYEWAAGTAYRTMRVQTFDWASPDGDTYLATHIRRAAVKTDDTVTPQWFQAGSAWGIYSPVTSNGGIAMCWATPGMWRFGSLRMTATSPITSVTFNPSKEG